VGISSTGALCATWRGACLAALAATGLAGAGQAAVVAGSSGPVVLFEIGPYATGTYTSYDELLLRSIGPVALADAAGGTVIVPPVRELRLSYVIDLDTGLGTATSYATDGSYSMTYTAGPGGFVLTDNLGMPMPGMIGRYSIDADSIVVTEFRLDGMLQALGGFPDFGEVGMSFRKSPVLFADEAPAGRWTKSGEHKIYTPSPIPLPASGALMGGALALGLVALRRRAARRSD
jgi:hypothetical protein